MTLEVELRLRRHTPACTASATDRLIQRVRTLEQTGRVDTVRVETWDCVRPGVQRHAGDLSVIGRFARWADDNDLCLEPGFKRRQVSSLVESGTHLEVVVPLACLAVYEEGDLRTVAPCSNGETVATVDDVVTRLERGEVSPGLEPETGVGAALADLTA